jgi:hypothetical protein
MGTAQSPDTKNVIQFRFEAAADTASLPDRVISYSLCAPFSGLRPRSKDNEAARRRRRRHIGNMLRTPTTKPTKLAEESELVLIIYREYLPTANTLAE